MTTAHHSRAHIGRRADSSAAPINSQADEYRPTITVLKSQDFPLTKRFYINESGEVDRENFQQARTFQAQSVAISGIRELFLWMETLSQDPMRAVVRGIPRVQNRNTWRTSGDFVEDPSGTSWVMLDIDGESLPDGHSVISPDAIQWFIEMRLPPEFRNVTCYYQFSSSAGILNKSGALLKPGLRVHLFYFLDRPIRGTELAAYLCNYCLDTDFYQIEANKGGVAQLKFGIDPAPIRSANQLHYVADPLVEKGVSCQLTRESRHGLLERGRDAVLIPPIATDLPFHVAERKKKLRESWMRERGYERRTVKVLTNSGPVTARYYRQSGVQGELQRGRGLDRTELLGEGEICRLFLDDEGTPGSWYVKKKQPQLAHRYGDGESIALKEISADAYAHVRDELRWFSEIPGHNLSLDAEGRVPDFNDFVSAKYSLILAPTGSGKTTRVISWMQSKAQGCAVVYVAQTIPLVNQMQDDLTSAGIACIHYQSLWDIPNIEKGIVVTTNESLPKVLAKLAINGMARYHLVVDEVHIALDDFSRSQVRLNQFFDAIGIARSTIFMTGTLTEIQRLMLSGSIARLNGGQLTEDQYCSYEFEPIKSNPLTVCPLKEFETDVIELFRSAQENHQKNEPIPRTMIMLSTSKMEMFRILAEQYGLSELVAVVSRPECLQEEIEAARVSDRPILVTSPLFSVGLNLTRELEVLYCRFDHIGADTSRVNQTINRANRGNTRCDVRIYANPDDEPFRFPAKAVVNEQIQEALTAETDLVNNAVDMPMLLDRMAYQEYRQIECNSNRAVGELLRTEGFQNYQVVESEARQRRKTGDAEVFKSAKREGKDVYDDKVRAAMPALAASEPEIHFFRLQTLSNERRNGQLTESPRTDREIESDELAILMHLCGLADPAKARKVDLFKVQVFFGDREPWLSDHVNAAGNHGWAIVAAQKTSSVIKVVNVLQQLAAGEIDGFGFARKLNRDKGLRDGIFAMVSNERELLSLKRNFDRLSDLRERVRQCNTTINREAAEKFALTMTDEFLQKLGVYFTVQGSGKGRLTDYSDPVVPSHWSFEEMVSRLKGRVAMLESLPQDVERVSRDLDPKSRYAYPIGKCRGCRLFNAACCVLGRRIDWSDEGIEPVDPVIVCDCEAFRPVRNSAAR